MAQAKNSLVASGSNGKNPPLSVALASNGMQRMIGASFNGDKRAMTKFTSNLMSVYTANPLLKDCKPVSIVSAGLQCAALNLSTSPSLGEAWIIPYGDQATFQIGKNGLVQLAIRSGQYLDLDTIEIHEGEYKGRDKNTGKPKFEFIENEGQREKAPVIGYLAYFELLNGFKKSVYFSKEKMLGWAARYSQAFDTELFKKYQTYLETGTGMTDMELRKCSSPWYNRFDSMGEKTVLKQLLTKWGIKSTDLETALESDEKIAGSDGFSDAFETQEATPMEADAVVQEVPKQAVADATTKNAHPQRTADPFEAVFDPNA